MPDSDPYFTPDPAPRSRQNYDPLIEKHATDNGIDPDLIRAMMNQESGGKPGAVSPKGARGLMQLMPGTAARFGTTDINDPDQNIRGGARYLKFLSDKFNGNPDLVIAGYNAGEGAVEKYGNKIPPYKETQQYVPAVKTRYAKITGQQLQSSAQDPYFTPESQQPKADPYFTPDTSLAPKVPQRPAKIISPMDLNKQLEAALKKAPRAQPGLDVGGKVGEPSQTEQTRGGLRGLAAMAGSPTQLLPNSVQDWIDEPVAAGTAALMGQAAGVARQLPTDPFEKNQITQGAAKALQKGSEQVAGQVQAAQADRGTVSRAAQNLVAGSIGSAPAMILTSLGVPAPIAFGLQSELEASGRDADFKDIVKDTAKGATIGALFEIPLPAKAGLLNAIGQRLTKAGIVGGGGALIDKATGQPVGTGNLTNAVFAMLGGKGETPEAETQTQIPDINAQLAAREAAVQPTLSAKNIPELRSQLRTRADLNAPAEAQAAVTGQRAPLPRGQVEEGVMPPLSARNLPDLRTQLRARADILAERKANEPAQVGLDEAGVPEGTIAESAPAEPHHSVNQNRRVRNVASGNAGQFKPGFKDSTEAPPAQPELITPAEAASESPETKPSRLAQGVEAKAVAANLTRGFADLPEYQTVKVADQAERAVKLLNDNPDLAKRIAVGTEQPPAGLLPESVFTAVENRALQQGDVDTIQDLARGSRSVEASGMGQRIRMLAERNPNSPVKAIADIEAARSKGVSDEQVRFATNKIKTEVGIEMKKAAPKVKDWSGFLDSIRC